MIGKCLPIFPDFPVRVGILFGDNVASLGIISGTPDYIM